MESFDSPDREGEHQITKFKQLYRFVPIHKLPIFTTTIKALPYSPFSLKNVFVNQNEAKLKMFDKSTCTHSPKSLVETKGLLNQFTHLLK